MSTTMQRPNKRILTLAGRDGQVLVTDSKINPETGNGLYYTYGEEGADTRLELLKALNHTLALIPTNVRLANQVYFLLPEQIAYLSYEDTRTHWLQNGTTKQGKEIAPEILAEVKRLHEILKPLGSQVQLFSQRRLKHPLYISYRVATWKLLDKLVPKKPQPESINAYDAF